MNLPQFCCRWWGCRSTGHERGHLKCDQCKDTFVARSELETHCILVHNKELLDCDKCDFRTTSMARLDQHRRDKHNHGFNANCRNTVCAQAPLSLTTDDQFQNRRGNLNHETVQPKRQSVSCFRCRDCGCEFTDGMSLQNHFLTLHKSEKILPIMPYHCTICQFTCPTQQTMMEHMRIHTGHVLQCRTEDCQFRTPYDSVLRDHVAHVHNDDYTFRCPHCGHAVGTRFAFDRHHIAHHPKPCRLCTVAMKRHFPSGDDQEACADGDGGERGGSSGGSCSGMMGDRRVGQVKRPRKQSKPRKLVRGSNRFRSRGSGNRCGGADAGCRRRRRRRRRRRHRRRRRLQRQLRLLGLRHVDVVGNRGRCRLWWPRRPCKSGTFAPVYKCWACNPVTVFNCRRNLIVHNIWRHSRKLFPCEHCGAHYGHQYQTVLHASRHHVPLGIAAPQRAMLRFGH